MAETVAYRWVNFVKVTVSWINIQQWMSKFIITCIVLNLCIIFFSQVGCDHETWTNMSSTSSYTAAAIISVSKFNLEVNEITLDWNEVEKKTHRLMQTEGKFAYLNMPQKVSEEIRIVMFRTKRRRYGTRRWNSRNFWRDQRRNIFCISIAKWFCTGWRCNSKVTKLPTSMG